MYTREGFPKEWALMWYYLGLGYAFMPGTPGAPEKELEDQYNSLQQAVACYKEALKVYAQKDYPEDWAKIQRAKENAQRLSDIAHRRLTKLQSH